MGVTKYIGDSPLRAREHIGMSKKLSISIIARICSKLGTNADIFFREYRCSRK